MASGKDLYPCESNLTMNLLKKGQPRGDDRYLFGCGLRPNPHKYHSLLHAGGLFSPLNRIYASLNPRSLRLFVTTKIELNAMAPAANIGFKKPSAAAGMSKML